MRVLFSSVAGYGHIFPLLPLAQAFRDRGDAVAVVTSPSYARHVEAAGLQLLPAGLDEDELNARYAPAKAKSLLLPIPERRRFVFSNGSRSSRRPRGSRGCARTRRHSSPI